MLRFIIFFCVCINTFSIIKIQDDVGLLSKDFIKSYESQYKDKRKEIVVVIKESIGNENPMIYATNILNKEDVGGKNGTGLVILVIMDIKYIEVSIGSKIEEVFTDYEIVANVSSKISEKFKNKKFEDGINTGIDNSIKIINEVIY